MDEVRSQTVESVDCMLSCNPDLSRVHIPFLDVPSDYEFTTNAFSLLHLTLTYLFRGLSSKKLEVHSIDSNSIGKFCD